MTTRMIPKIDLKAFKKGEKKGMRIIKNVKNTPCLKQGYRNEKAFILSMKGKYKLSLSELNLILSLMPKNEIGESLEITCIDYCKLYKYASIQPKNY